MGLGKEKKVDIVLLGVIGLVIFALVPIDKIFEFMSKSTGSYMLVVLIAAIISVPGFMYSRKIINKFQKDKWDK